MARKKAVETTVREIRRKTRKKYSVEEKIRIVLEGLLVKARLPSYVVEFEGINWN